MKIPFYFDDPNDLYKFNGIDKKFNQYVYYTDQKFLNTIPEYFYNSIQVVDSSYHDMYYYPIYASWQFYQFRSKFLVSIPNNVLQDVKKNKCKILIFNTVEGYSLNEVEILIKEKIINIYKLSYNNFVTLTGNFDKVSPNGIKNIYFNTFENLIKYYNLNIDMFTKKVIDNLYSKKLKNYKFICLQRRPKTQRLMLFTELYENKNNGILTMGIGDDNNFKTINQIERNFFNKQTYKKYKNLQLKKVLPCEFDVNLVTENPVEDKHIKKYLQSYLHIVSETYFETNKNQLFFSEKIYKPVIFLQPFIIFSQPFSLQKFRELGFKTFSSHYINEGYDNIIDNRKRFLAALTQVKKVISMSHTELHETIKYFRETLLHNYYLLKFRTDNSNKELLIELYDHLLNDKVSLN
jgi:hypothetical protein